jgi:hypothetical protein
VFHEADVFDVGYRAMTVRFFGHQIHQKISMTINLLKPTLGVCHESGKSKQSTLTMEQRQVDRSKVATKIEGNLGNSHSFADGQKYARTCIIQSRD